MKKINVTKLLFLFLSFALFSCGSEDDNYKTFTGSQEALLFNDPTSTLEVIEDEPSFIEVLVSSTTISNVDRLIPISISPTSTALSTQYSVDLSTAVIPAGKNTAYVKVFSGDFDSLPLAGGVTLVFVFDEAGYVLPNRTNHVLTIERGCTDTKVDFRIAFDGYASEITWFVTNNLGVVVASGGGYADGLATFNQRLCLTSGNYTFVMNDSYGDGLSFPSNGSFSLRLVDAPFTTLVTGGGDFGFSTGPINFVIE